jgi:hypothetical protein
MDESPRFIILLVNLISLYRYYPPIVNLSFFSFFIVNHIHCAQLQKLIILTLLHAQAKDQIENLG